MIKIISIRVARWASEMDMFRGIFMDSLIRDLPIIITNAPQVPKSTHSRLPTLGLALKLNFDRCSLGNLSPMCFSSLISNASGSCMLAYSRPMEIGNAILIEI